MASITRGEVEILVHITAPSRGQDDVRYRALAQAYLEFEPSERHSMPEGLMRDEVKDANAQLQEELARSTQTSQASYQPSDEDSESIPISIRSSQNVYLNRIQEFEEMPSPILSFNSVFNNADSPRFWNFTTPRPILSGGSQEWSRIADSQESYEPTLSTFIDSQLEGERPGPAFSSPSGVWEIFLQQIENSEWSSSLHAGEDRQGQQSASPHLPIIAFQETPSSMSAISGHEKSSTSEEPSSPSPKKRAAIPHSILKTRSDNFSLTQDPISGLKRKWVAAVEKNTASSSAPSRLPIGGATPSSSTEAATKRQRIGVDEANMTGSKALLSSRTTEMATPSPAYSKSIWANKFEIRPPPPDTLTGDVTPDKLITYSLHDLARKMPLDKLFIPEEQKREIRPMERGYWLVSCRSWDPRLRQRCWEYLGNCAGKGLAGWGVWCARDEDFETMRVYCWGKVVAHIYLLLYLASENKMKNAGACWIGGDGQAILKMGV